MTTMYFGGAETPSWRNRLDEAGVRHLAINFTYLYQRLPISKPWWISEHVPEDAQVFLYWSPSDNHDDAFWFDYHDFAVQNYELMGDRLLVMAPPQGEVESWMAKQFDGSTRYDSEWVVVQKEDLRDRRLQAKVAAAARSHKLMGIGVITAKQLKMSKLSATLNGSWYSASRFGELVVWDGKQIHRATPTRRDDVLAKYRVAVNRSGIDRDRLKGGDKDALLDLSLWSWKNFADSLTGVRPMPIRRIVTEPGSESDTENSSQTSTALVRRELEVLPTMLAVRNEEGELEGFKTPAHSMRQCDDCFLAGQCPKFQPGAKCAYEIPVQIQNKGQVVGSAIHLLEMQLQRIEFLRMSEDLQGGYADPTLSSEIERYFVMLERTRDIMDNRDSFTVHIEGRGDAGGILSEIFGKDTGNAAQQLDNGGMSPAQTDQYLEDIIDVPEVD